MDHNPAKPHKTPLADSKGAPLTHVAVGCSWGTIVSKGGFLGLDRRVTDIDLDLSCVLYDEAGKIADAIVSPLYRPEFLARYGLPPGSVSAAGSAIHLTSIGDTPGATDADNLTVTVDLDRLSPSIRSIYFILSNCGPEDFSQIPATRLRVSDPTASSPEGEITRMEIKGSGRLKGARSIVMGKVYRSEAAWCFKPIADAYPDSNVGETVRRITLGYV